jgi:hypothetical protein
MPRSSWWQIESDLENLYGGRLAETEVGALIQVAEDSHGGQSLADTGRLWSLGERVRLDNDPPIVGTVVAVYPGGDTRVEIDGTNDYLTVDENYWTAEERP